MEKEQLTEVHATLSALKMCLAVNRPQGTPALIERIRKSHELIEDELKHPTTAIDLIAQGKKKQKITKISISVSGPGGVSLCSSDSNAEFMTITEAFDQFKEDLKILKDEDPERFKNITLK